MKLVLADDHAIFRAGLRLLLETYPDIEVVGEAGSGAVVQLIQATGPDIALIDVDMPGCGGIQATQHICATSTCRVILLTGFRQYVEPGILAGARGYLVKDAHEDDIIAAIHRVYDGGVYIHSSVQPMVVDALRNPAERLSERELTILGLVAEGTTNRAIGDKLGLSERTIKEYLSEMMQKLRARDRTHAVVLAIRRGLILP